MEDGRHSICKSLTRGPQICPALRRFEEEFEVLSTTCWSSERLVAERVTPLVDKLMVHLVVAVLFGEELLRRFFPPTLSMSPVEDTILLPR